MMPQNRERTKFIGAQNTEISISADGDFGEMKKTETPSKSRRVGRYDRPFCTLSRFKLLQVGQGSSVFAGQVFICDDPSATSLSGSFTKGVPLLYPQCGTSFMF